MIILYILAIGLGLFVALILFVLISIRKDGDVWNLNDESETLKNQNKKWKSQESSK